MNYSEGYTKMIFIISVIVILALINIILHIIGLYLLRCLNVDGRTDIQHIYISSLSVIEIFSSICFCLKIVLNASVKGNESDIIEMHVNIVFFTFSSFIIYMNIFYVAIDKVMQVVWNIKYPVYWSLRKA